MRRTGSSKEKTWDRMDGTGGKESTAEGKLGDRMQVKCMGQNTCYRIREVWR